MKKLIAVFIVVGSSASIGKAQEYRPFVEVRNVCPACEPDRYDRILLEDGREVRAWLVAETRAFYVLERHGALRAVAKKLVKGIGKSRLRDTTERERIRKKHRDQILFPDGHVISGEIVELRRDTGMYRLRSFSGVQHLAYQNAIWMVFEDGKLTFHKPQS